MRWLISSAAGMILFAAGLFAQASGNRTIRPVSPLVERIEVITENGGRLDVSPDGKWIAFDRKDSGGYFDIFLMRTDGSDVRCLTCGKPQLPYKHIGNPAWHPSGDYIAFQAQSNFRGLGTLTDYFGNPGAGINNNIWVMDRDGKRFWQITNVPNRIGGVLHPSFSHSGDRIFWSERYASKGGDNGLWHMRIARWSSNQKSRESTAGAETHRPGRVTEFYETHGFSPDDKMILFSADCEPGQRLPGIDIYSYNLTTRKLSNLTNSLKEWDEHAHFSPSGRHIVWMTNKEIGPVVEAAKVKTDYWVMNADGGDKRRLTYFNQRDTSEYIDGGATAADFAWHPDGRSFFGYLITDVKAVSGPIVRVYLREKY